MNKKPKPKIMPPRKATNKVNELFSINGLSIKSGAVYKIENRFDANAPSGFQKERTTKLPSADIANTIQCPFVVSNKATGEGVFDTGLHKYSPCYKNQDEKSVAEKLKVLADFVVKPYEAKTGEDGKLAHNNDKFWSEYMVNLYADRYFSVADPDDMLALYVAMISGELCPEDEQGNPRYRNADYVIIDKAKEKTLKQKRATTNIDTIGEFYMLLKENPQKLTHILRYIGLSNITDKVDDVTLKTMFYTWLDQSDRNAEKFEQLVQDCEDKTKEEIIYLHSKLKRVVETNKGLSKNSVGDYVYNGQPLGKDLKTVASNLVASPELSQIKAQILEEFNV